MINPFTAQAEISRIQQDVLRPLYTMYSGQEAAPHAWLLAETGRAIAGHRHYIEEVCGSRLVSIVFKIIKFLGGAEQLTAEDFARFTSYVNDGGIQAMITMLLAIDKENTFVEELQRLPDHVRTNAAPMLAKAKSLHTDFITGFFQETFGSVDDTPAKLRDNFVRSREFISRLVQLATTHQEKGV
ncbi:MAG: hypothetical protein KJ630_11855 [Proteobacteria bacterium]|nr:hypothetical protein [Pseudomonadota bacterium]